MPSFFDLLQEVTCSVKEEVIGQVDVKSVQTHYQKEETVGGGNAHSIISSFQAEA